MLKNAPAEASAQAGAFLSIPGKTHFFGKPLGNNLLKAEVGLFQNEGAVAIHQVCCITIFSRTWILASKAFSFFSRSA